eukprot:10446802-Karenia_brevis.AAC.1
MVAEPNSAVAAASSSPDQSVQLEEKMMKVVAITVKQIMGELVPHLQSPQHESIRTVDGDKKVKLDE